MAHQFKGEVEIEIGLGLPNVTTAFRTSYTPPRKGYKVFDTDLDVEFTWSGIAWIQAATDADVQAIDTRLTTAEGNITTAQGDITTNTTAITGKVSKAGDTMSGDLVMGDNEVTGLPATPSATGATSKEYVDAAVAAVSAGAASSLDDLTDVDTNTTAPSTGETLFFDGTNFVNRDVVKADISDFSDGDYATAAQGATADSALQNITNESIGDLSDVDITTAAPTNGQTLIWNSTDGEFQPGTISADDRVLKAGDTMTGDLVMSNATPTITFDATGTANDGEVTLDGGSMTMSRGGGSVAANNQGAVIGGGSGNALLTLISAGVSSIDYNLTFGGTDVFSYVEGTGTNDGIFIFTPKVRSASTVSGDNGTTLTTKDYVDTAANSSDKVLKAGDTMTGSLNMTGSNTDINLVGGDNFDGTDPALILTGGATIELTESSIELDSDSGIDLDGAYAAFASGGYADFYDGATTAATDRNVTVDSTGIQLRAEAAGADAIIRFTSVVPGQGTAPGMEWRGAASALLGRLRYDIDDTQDLILEKGSTRLSVQASSIDVNTRVDGVTTLAGDAGTTLATKDYVDAAAAAGGAVSELDDLSDVTITSSASGHILIHDGTDYKNRSAVKADISDFTETDYVHTTGDETIGGNKTFSNNVIVTGDLTVNGTTTTVNSANLEVTDNIINLNKDEVGAGVTAGSAGIRIERGTETDVQFIFDESDDTFKAGEIGSERILATSHQESFVVADWTVGTPNTYTIAAATHGLGYTAGQVFMVQVFESAGGTASLTTIDTEVDETTGDITLKTIGSTFDGAVIITK